MFQAFMETHAAKNVHFDIFLFIWIILTGLLNFVSKLEPSEHLCRSVVVEKHQICSHPWYYYYINIMYCGKHNTCCIIKVNKT